ncbi:peptidoglycan bridge formation glycyltransferase FemA/FemB family protein [Candidatus Roizmanbacteria bacterium]|nr:MAG: peptidoglycan bridge formation glycyltransferase FemA/FemB family protein [Candidatus Roizmanbacteria bacterium]
MKYNIIPDDFDPQQFNEAAHHPLQSWQWGEARKSTGTSVVRIGGFEENKLEEVFTMSCHPLPKLPWKVGYIPRSPLPGEQLVQFLKEYAKQNSIFFIKFEPDVCKNDANKLPSDLTKAPHPLFPAWTQKLDLTKSEDELMKQLKSKTRYNVRYAEKNGVTVREDSTDEGFAKFSKLYFDTVERQTYYGHNRSYHQKVWQAMKNGIAHILIAEYQGEPLAAYELFFFDHKLYYPYGGSSDRHRNLMASNLLMWEAIRFGKRMGATEFDMWGSLAPDYDRSKSWAGFTRFKEGYGTEFYQFQGSYDLVVNPVIYPAYTVVYAIRDLILKLT